MSAVPALEPVELADLLDAAACLWESTRHLLEDIHKSQADPTSLPLMPWQQQLLNHVDAFGSMELRAMVVAWSEEVHRDWERAFNSGEFDGCFDWEFVPEWLVAKLTKHFEEQPS